MFCQRGRKEMQNAKINAERINRRDAEDAEERSREREKSRPYKALPTCAIG